MPEEADRTKFDQICITPHKCPKYAVCTKICERIGITTLVMMQISVGHDSYPYEYESDSQNGYESKTGLFMSMDMNRVDL